MKNKTKIDKEPKNAKLPKSKKSKFTKIYVGNLNYAMKDGDLHNLFTKFGKVGKIEVIREKRTQKSTGIAFLQMYNPTDAKKSIDSLDGKEIQGRTLKVSVALERSEDEKKPKKNKRPKGAVKPKKISSKRSYS